MCHHQAVSIATVWGMAPELAAPSLLLLDFSTGSIVLRVVGLT
jgi:hypothetical protein